MKKSDIAKQKIINATMTLLCEQGHVTVKEISEFSNVNVAAVNYYFGDKQSLCNKVILYVLDDLKQSIEQTITQYTGNLTQCVTDIIVSIYDWTLKYSGVFKYSLTSKKNENNILFNHFLFDKSFTNKVFHYLEKLTDIKDKDILYIKYMIIFSSIAFPMMLEIIGKDNVSQTSLSRESFKNKYVNELLKNLLG